MNRCPDEELKSPVVLVVDDQPGIRDCLRLILADTYDVVEAASGAAALEILACAHVDLVLLDLVMPGADGIEILGAIRDRYPGLPVIVLTAVTIQWLRAEAVRLGAYAYLTKPFDERMLMDTVSSALDRHGHARAIQSPVSRPMPSPDVFVLSTDAAWATGVALVLKTLGRPVAVADVSDVGGSVLAARPICMVVRVSADETDNPANLQSLVRNALPACRVIAQRPDPGHVKPIVERVADALGAQASFSSPVGRAVEHIMHHYSSRLTVTDVAQVAGTSASYLAHLFPVQVGMTVHAFMLKIRVEIARRLLSTTDTKLAVIAELVGFSDASHLSRAVQRETGLGTRDHRRQSAKGQE